MRHELRYTLTALDGLAEAFHLSASVDLVARFNIAPGQRAPIGQGTAIELLRWGLLPRWRGHGGTRGPLIHAAPIEAVPSTPLLRDAFKKRRCLVVADGCFAWRELNQPIWFHPEPRRVVAFAGVWDVNADDAQRSFAILTGPPLDSRVRDPMPLIVDPRAYEEWLDPAVSAERANELLADPSLDGWRADVVSTWMSSAAHDDPKCVAPIGNPSQGDLF